jgi:ATP-binding cassette subfamily F protein uup
MQEAPKRQTKGQISLASNQRRLGKRAIEAEDLAVWATDEARTAGSTPLLKAFSYDFSPEDRIGIIGPNGSGKSTLLDLIAGRRQPHGGRLELGGTVKLAYFDQHSETVLGNTKALEKKVIDVVKEAASTVEVDGSQLSASQLLERFLFPPAQQHQPVSKLSGGERRRLHLCRLLIEAPNVLLLDEPTNDLDVHTLTVLEDFLEDFRGCVVVVSHDRYFLDRTVDRLFSFENGELQRFEGNYSAYLDRQAAIASPPATRAAAKPASPDASAAKDPAPHKPTAPAKTRRRSFKESRELAALETNLPAWEQRRGELERLMGASGSDYTALEALTQELSALLAQIEAGEERWLELSELSA